MNIKKNNSARVFTRNCLIVSLALLATSCFFSTKAIYFEKEISVAEGAAARYRELHNQQNFSAIYDLLDKQANPSSESALAQIKAVYDSVGRSLESRLVEKKAFNSPSPEYTSQVKLAYETKFEKGNYTELFAWNIRNSSEAVLVEYRVEPAPTPSPR